MNSLPRKNESFTSYPSQNTFVEVSSISDLKSEFSFELGSESNSESNSESDSELSSESSSNVELHSEPSSNSELSSESNSGSSLGTSPESNSGSNSPLVNLSIAPQLASEVVFVNEESPPYLSTPHTPVSPVNLEEDISPPTTLAKAYSFLMTSGIGTTTYSR